MRKSKKDAQIIGQVFVLILAAVIFILILMYGYKAIQDIRQRGDDVSFIDFATSLKTEVNSISLSYGSVKKLELSGLPQKYKTICFVTGKQKGDQWLDPPSGDLAGLAETSIHGGHPLIYELYEVGGDNVFFEPSAPKNIKLDNIEAFDAANPTLKWFCAPMDRGSIALKLEGLGNSVRISPWPLQ